MNQITFTEAVEISWMPRRELDIKEVFPALELIKEKELIESSEMTDSRPPRLYAYKATATEIKTSVKHVAGVGRGRYSFARIPDEIIYEWPEIKDIATKLVASKRLSRRDELWINELAEATGWDRDDIIDDLMAIYMDPSERAERYEELFKKYYAEALEYKKEGDTRQAGEKLWGAVTALIKFYAAIKGVPIVQWSRAKIDRFITHNIESRYRRMFRDLLDKTHRLHEHFYEGDLDNRTFEDRWKEIMELLEEVKKVIYTI